MSGPELQPPFTPGPLPRAADAPDGGASTLPPRSADLPDSPLLARIADGVIGDDLVLPGPYGPRRVTYTDWTASGRALDFVEDFLRDHVLPSYANTHSEASGTGRQTTRLREDARALVHRAVDGDEETCVIFAGSGATGALDRLVGILGLRVPSRLEDAYGLTRHIPPEQRPVVFVGPFEHHSNELPWRESVADVVRVGTDRDGHVDEQQLEHALAAHAARPLLVGAFSAASNVTGILTDTDRISALLHRHGALAFWDYAAAAPYLAVSMQAPPGGDPLAYKDALVLSPHKFVGGPGTPGVLAVRRSLLTNRVPDVVGGGTVAYVTATGHRYLDDPVQREEGGTPAIVESVRAGLVLALKDAVGVDVIRAHEHDFARRAVQAWQVEPGVEILGNLDADRLAVVSFVVHAPGGRLLHHNVVVALLNDLFGIQARGGCSCAGPYGHALLHIDGERSAGYDREIAHGCEGIRPGWVRVSFPYFLAEPVFAFVVAAVAFVARHGYRFLPDYRFDPAAGTWQHRAGPVEPPVRLTNVVADPDEGLRLCTREDGSVESRAPVSVLPDYLAQANAMLADRPDGVPDDEGALGDEVERLRWFLLPPVCLTA
jgi:selenocysteine lyase/cysteine desulfurase